MGSWPGSVLPGQEWRHRYRHAQAAIVEDATAEYVLVVDQDRVSGRRAVLPLLTQLTTLPGIDAGGAWRHAGRKWRMTVSSPRGAQNRDYRQRSAKRARGVSQRNREYTRLDRVRAGVRPGAGTGCKHIPSPGLPRIAESGFKAMFTCERVSMYGFFWVSFCSMCALV